MSERSGSLVFANHKDFPISILHVLAEKRFERAAHVIPTANARGLVDLLFGAREAKIVFIILVANQFFIEIANALKNALLPASINHGVHVPFIAGSMGARPADGKRRVKHR